uniref:Uncharacterized protein n=1 Tax=Romanomermis culicivorax TaxID=13658 RepID=A0A915KS90_ROMCU
MGSSARKFIRQDSESTPEPAVLIRAFRKFFRDERKRSNDDDGSRGGDPNKSYANFCWVLFKNGTAVLLGSYKDNMHETLDEMASSAKRYLKHNGKLVVGTPLSDFTVNYDDDLCGWMVRFQNERIFTFVPGEKVNNGVAGADTFGSLSGEDGTNNTGNNSEARNMTFGLLGRMLRQKDARELSVIYVYKPEVGRRK